MSAGLRVPLVCLLTCGPFEFVIFGRRPALSPAIRDAMAPTAGVSTALTRSGKLIAPHQTNAWGWS